jgi:hypothetical protein
MGNLCTDVRSGTDRVPRQPFSLYGVDSASITKLRYDLYR